MLSLIRLLIFIICQRANSQDFIGVEPSQHNLAPLTSDEVLDTVSYGAEDIVPFQTGPRMTEEKMTLAYPGVRVFSHSHTFEPNIHLTQYTDTGIDVYGVGGPGWKDVTNDKRRWTLLFNFSVLAGVFAVLIAIIRAYTSHK